MVDSIMRRASDRTTVQAFTLVELLLVILVLLFLVSFIVPPAFSGKPRWAGCNSNQKQAAMGFFMWKADNNEHFPWQDSPTNGGTMESVDRGYAAPNFQILSNYLKEPRIFVCPSDKARFSATNYAQFRNVNLSYFVAFDQRKQPTDALLTGDRHLAAANNPVEPGLFVYSTNLTMTWTHELHNNSKNRTSGVLSFADSHVESAPNFRLDFRFQHEGLTTNHLAIP